MFRFGRGAGGGQNGAQSYLDDVDHEDEYPDEDDEPEDEEEEEEWEAPPERYDGNILSSDQEKSKVLIVFKDLRNENMFCDVTFLCQGKEFRAHKVVVSSWSRWLRALLCEEHPSEDVISVDVFDPLSFGKVLDYMYGTPLPVTIETAEDLLKVVHRLQLQALEESIWIFLMKIVDPNNCKQLHELADRYDCPPLKLSAWRVLQESIPGYASLPAGIMAASAAAGVLKGTGLTGPGDPEFLSNIAPEPGMSGVHDARDHLDELPSIFTHFTPPPPSEAEGGTEHHDDDNDDGDDDERAPRAEHKETYTNPKELPPTASATELVKAWSARLQQVYQKCNAPEGEEYPDPTTMEAERGKKIMFTAAGLRGPMGSPKEKGKSPALGAKKGGKGKYSHIREIDWRLELKQFYLGINMPEKLPGIGEILITWKGKEEQMLSHLITKYKRRIPPPVADHLRTLSEYVETQTESSFVR
jgi:hypothetical protein